MGTGRTVFTRYPFSRRTARLARSVSRGQRMTAMLPVAAPDEKAITIPAA